MPRPYGSICFFVQVEKCGRFLNRPYGMWGIWSDLPGCGGRFGGYCGTVVTVPYMVCRMRVGGYKEIQALRSFAKGLWIYS